MRLRGNPCRKQSEGRGHRSAGLDLVSGLRRNPWAELEHRFNRDWREAAGERHKGKRESAGNISGGRKQLTESLEGSGCVINAF